MKFKLLFISFLFLLGATYFAVGQSQNEQDAILPNMFAPKVTVTEIKSPMRQGKPEASKPAQEIPEEEERGSGAGNGSPFPLAAPGNNDCANAITLTVNAGCIAGSNKEATLQAGESTSCQGSITKSVWYKFVAASPGMFVEIERTASSGCYLSSAVYSGSCLPSNSISCEDASGGPNLNIHNLTGLSTGTTYYVQVSYTGGSFCGNNNNASTGADFCIKAGVTQNCGTCGATCSAICVYPSTPTVSQVTSTCTATELKPRINAGQSKTLCYSFNAIATSFSLQMIINSVGCGSGGNVSTFNWQLYASTCAGVLQSGTLSNLNVSGLTTGAAYVLCYSWVSLCQQNSVYPYIVATSPLPVKILNFDGKQVETSTVLNWHTASEINNNYFAIQRSADGVNFKEAGKVMGAGTSTNILKYTFKDEDPLSGVNYYRLAQYDYDGAFSYSKIIAVRHNKNAFIKVENNRVTDQLQIIVQADNASKVTFEIINNLGAHVIQSSELTIKGYNKFSIPVESLTKGSYFLKTETNSQTSWIKFMKL